MSLRPRLLPLCCLPLFLTGACLGPPRGEEVFDEEQQLELYVTTATYLYEDDSLDRSLEQAVKALEIEPDHIPMRRMVGWIKLRSGSNEDLILAERFFRDLVGERDRSNSTLLGLATALERLGLAYDENAKALAAAQDHEPDPASVGERARPLAQKARDHWHESLEVYTETLEDGEGSTRSMNGLQRVHALLGNYEQSLEWSDRLLERSASELETWRRLLTEGEIDAREEALFKENEAAAVRLQNDTHLFQATLLHRLGRAREAIAHLDEVAINAPRLAQVYSMRAQLRTQVGDYETAIQDVDHFLRLSDAPYESPEIQAAFDLRSRCEKALE